MKIEKTMRNIESKIQQACVRWWCYTCHTFGLERALLYAIPNGGARTAQTGALLKAEGVVAGVADLHLAVANKKYHSLYIEMKTPKGTQQATQKTFQRLVEQQGHRYAVCRSLDEFINLVTDYLKER